MIVVFAVISIYSVYIIIVYVVLQVSLLKVISIIEMDGIETEHDRNTKILQLKGNIRKNWGSTNNQKT